MCLDETHLRQETVQLAVDLDAYAKVGLAHMSQSPMLVHVQDMVSLNTVLDVVHCASFTVAQVPRVHLKHHVTAAASQDTFSTVSKGASCSCCCSIRSKSGARQGAKL